MPKKPKPEPVNPKLILRAITNCLPRVKEREDFIVSTVLGFWAYSNDFITKEDLAAGIVEFSGTVAYSQLARFCKVDERTARWRVKQLKERWGLVAWKQTRYGINFRVRLSVSDDQEIKPEHDTEEAPQAGAQAEPKRGLNAVNLGKPFESGNGQSENGNEGSEIGNGNSEGGNETTRERPSVTPSVFSGFGTGFSSGDAGVPPLRGGGSVRTTSAEQKKPKPQGTSSPEPPTGASPLAPTRADCPGPVGGDAITSSAPLGTAPSSAAPQQPKCLMCGKEWNRDPNVGGRICPACVNGPVPNSRAPQDGDQAQDPNQTEGESYCPFCNAKYLATHNTKHCPSCKIGPDTPIRLTAEQARNYLAATSLTPQWDDDFDLIAGGNTEFGNLDLKDIDWEDL